MRSFSIEKDKSIKPQHIHSGRGDIMKKLIKEIIIADEVARESVERAKAERDQVQAKLKNQSKDIESVYQKQTEETLKVHKAKLEDELAKEKEKYAKEFLESLERLQVQYQENKDSWLKSIYENCLNA
jgi:hypothetical protein